MVVVAVVHVIVVAHVDTLVIIMVMEGVGVTTRTTATA